MNRTCKVALLLAAGAVGISLAASAQKQQPGAIAPPPRAELGPQRRRISLREALQLAAKQSPDVASARATAAIAEASVRRAWTAWQPDVTATGTFDHTNGISVVDFRPLVTALGHPELAADPRFAPTTIVAQNSRYATLQLNQPLLTPQGLFLPGVANSSAEAALRGFDEAREQVLLNVARNYLALQGLEGLLEAAREAEKVALRREQDARARIAAGTDVEIALLRAQTETSRARA
ncbi:MAG: TolC family protein, partial [Deltaproteobacteria bacterium]